MNNQNNNLCYVSKYFGYDKNYFYVLRLTSTLRFNYIKAINPDSFFHSYIKYIEEMEAIKFKLQDIYYYLEDKNLIHKFSIYASKHKLFKNYNSLSVTFPKVIFANKQGFHFHKTYIKYKELIPLFNQFKKELSSTHKTQELH